MISHDSLIAEVLRYIWIPFASIGAWIFKRQIDRIDSHDKRILNLETGKVDTSTFNGSLEQLRQTIKDHNDNVSSGIRDVRKEVRATTERIDKVLDYLIKEKQ